MKRNIFFTIFWTLFLPIASKAQEGKTAIKDTARYNVGSTHIMVVKSKKDTTGKKKEFVNISFGESSKDSAKTKLQKRKKGIKTGYWSGFEMGFTSLLDANMNNKPVKGYEYLETNPGKSIAVQLNLFEKTIPICKNYVQLVTGLGIEWNNFRFTHSTVLQPGKETVMGYVDTSTTRAYALSKLVTNYVNVPLLLEFNTSRNPRRNVHIAGGLVVGYLYRDHTKRTYFENGEKIKEKSFDNFNLSPFRYSLSARIGYGNLNVFANYGLNGLFRDGHGPELHPFTVGITLVGF